MNNNEYNNPNGSTGSIKGFEKKWSKPVLSGGFTQIPNDLIRSQAQLGLSSYDTSVLFHILSVGKGFASAKTISLSQGIAIGTVRKSFRKLKKLGYVVYIDEEGSAHRFNVKGLIDRVNEIALKRQRDMRQKNMGIVVLETNPVRETYSNKDYINTKKDTKETSGLNRCKETIQKINERKNLNTKPP